MGVGGGFWDVLRPVARKETLDSLRGKKMAIDLSYWLIQLLTAVKSVRIRKAHIRLLFFRTIHLVAKIGLFPVFVVDGEPPPLKLQVRLARFSRISGVPANNSADMTDTQMMRNSIFTDSIEECVELLKLLGMPVLRAKHEAEGLCAELDKHDLVDACVTPDSDAFLYGAKRVIKILQADFKDPVVEYYTMDDIRSCLGLHREHLVALALLAGCDYNVQGVPGIGCHNAVRLVKTVPQHEILDRLRAWGVGEFEFQSEINGMSQDVLDCEKADEHKVMSKNPDDFFVKVTPHCSNCGHPGTKRLHSKLGCKQCSLFDSASYAEHSCGPKMQGFKCTCESCREGEIRKKYFKQVRWQLKACKKISETKGFPNEHIIQIYMNSRHDKVAEEIDGLSTLTQKPPQMEALERFLADHLFWNSTYVRQKTLPLLSFICLLELAAKQKNVASGLVSSGGLINGLYAPHSIQRIKISFSRPFYKLRWGQVTRGTPQEDWLGLSSIPPNQEREADDNLNSTDELVSALDIDTINNTVLFTTDEDMKLVRDACPHLVKRFEQEQEARQKSQRRNLRKKKEQDLFAKEKQLSLTSFFKVTKEVITTEDRITNEDMAMGRKRQSTNVTNIEDANTLEDAFLHPSKVRKLGDISPGSISRQELSQEGFLSHRMGQTPDHLPMVVGLDITPPSSSLKERALKDTMTEMDSSLQINERLPQGSVRRRLF